MYLMSTVYILQAVSVGSAVAASITALFWDFSMAPTAGVRDAAANLAVTVGLVGTFRIIPA